MGFSRQEYQSCHSLLQNTSQLWCWRRLLRAPWKARRPNQCILKEINPEYSLEGLMLKLKLQYFGHLIETWVRSLGQEDPWRREWLPTPVFLPEASHGQKSLAGYSPWGRRVDMSERLTQKTNPPPRWRMLIT